METPPQSSMSTEIQKPQHWYVHTHDLQGRATYERTTGTLRAAQDRVKELQLRDVQATYSEKPVNGAYY